jgi:sporulation protein YlmC with PRC-barrel domain
MAWTLADATALRGLTVVDPEAERIGRLEDVYLDRRTGLAEWATVKTGLFGRHVTFVPIADAYMNPAADVVVHVDDELVKHAPRIEPGDVLTPAQERVLYEHYGRSDYDAWHGEDHTTALGLPAEEEPADGRRLRRLIVVIGVPD